MRASLVVALASLAILAGCIGNAGDPAEADGNDSNGTVAVTPNTEPTDPDSNEDQPAADTDIANQSKPEPIHPRFAPAVNVTKDLPAAEPMLDVAPDGTIYIAGTGAGYPYEADPTPQRLTAALPRQSVWRSTDGGANWTQITPDLPGGGDGGVDNVIAAGPNGTVYYGNSVNEAFAWFRSEDRGDSWTPIPGPRAPPEGHRAWLVTDGSSTVHAAVTGTPPVNDIWYQRSSDRGTTWRSTELVSERGDLSTDLAIGPTGTAYLARVEEGGLTLYTSPGDGLLWTSERIVEFDGEYVSSWAALEVGPNGTGYAAWAEMEDGRSLTHYAYSQGDGNWSKPRPIVEISGSHALPWMDVRAEGQLGFVYYATNETGAPGETDGRWYPHYAFLDDADSENPRVFRTRLTDWPAREGVICPDGFVCESGTRELLDFTWIEFGPEDRAHLAFGATWRGGEDNFQSAFPVYAGERESFQPPTS